MSHTSVRLINGGLCNCPMWLCKCPTKYVKTVYFWLPYLVLGQYLMMMVAIICLYDVVDKIKKTI